MHVLQEPSAVGATERSASELGTRNWSYTCSTHKNSSPSIIPTSAPRSAGRASSSSPKRTTVSPTPAITCIGACTRKRLSVPTERTPNPRTAVMPIAAATNHELVALASSPAVARELLARELKSRHALQSLLPHCHRHPGARLS